eukprot:scaffold4868_cov83-Skeletonema_menzelii.AAC.1
MRSSNNFSTVEAGAIQIGPAPWKPVLYKLAQWTKLNMAFGSPLSLGFQSMQFPYRWRLRGGKDERWGWLGDPAIP